MGWGGYDGYNSKGARRLSRSDLPWIFKGDLYGGYKGCMLRRTNNFTAVTRFGIIQPGRKLAQSQPWMAPNQTTNHELPPPCHRFGKNTKINLLGLEEDVTMYIVFPRNTALRHRWTVFMPPTEATSTPIPYFIVKTSGALHKDDTAAETGMYRGYLSAYLWVFIPLLLD